jgi:hypothetical protein
MNYPRHQHFYQPLVAGLALYKVGGNPVSELSETDSPAEQTFVLKPQTLMPESPVDGESMLSPELPPTTGYHGVQCVRVPILVGIYVY